MYHANLIAHNLHTSQENRRKQEILFEKEILSLSLEIKRYGYEKKQNVNHRKLSICNLGVWRISGV